MSKDDTAAIKMGDLSEALVLLTRLPVTMGTPRGANAAWAWPLVGLATGLIAATVAGLAVLVGLPYQVAGGLAITAQILATGAMHEDGLADCADGFWGGHDPAGRLTIMKDSQIGTYGTLALGLSVLLRWQCIVALISFGHLFWPLMVAGVASRGAMLAVMATMDFARDTGLARQVGQPNRRCLHIGLLASAIVMVMGAGFMALPVAIVTGLAAWGSAALAKAKIGGQTGDVLGATQQICEFGALACLVALL